MSYELNKLYYQSLYFYFIPYLFSMIFLKKVTFSTFQSFYLKNDL